MAIPALFDSENSLIQLESSLDTNIVKYVNPMNLEQEKQKFFEELGNGNSYNPRFDYATSNIFYSYFALDPEFEQLKKQIMAVQTDNSAIGELLEKKKQSLLAEVNLMKHIGKENFPKISKEYFGVPSKSMVRQAQEMISRNDVKSKIKNRSSASLKKYFEEYLSRKGLDIKIEISENMSSDVSINPLAGTIWIRANAGFSENDFARLVIHEIETHFFRYLNGKMQPFRVFSSGLSRDWIATEEGLAVVNEEKFGLLDNSTLRKYAGRLVAVDFAIDHGFFETFKMLEQHFSQEQAYSITQRVKRGIKNTEENGAFTKDFVYFAGSIKVREFLEQGGKLKELYLGKISVEDVEHIRNIHGLKEPVYSPNY